MIERHDDCPVPAKARENRQVGEPLLRSRGDCAVDLVVRNHLRNLLRGALVEVQPDIRISTSELTDDVGQDVARLRVCGAYGKASPALLAQLCREVANALCLLEDSQGTIDDLLSRRRDARQIASLAHEYLEPELVLEQLDLLAHAGL